MDVIRSIGESSDNNYLEKVATIQEPDDYRRATKYKMDKHFLACCAFGKQIMHLTLSHQVYYGVDYTNSLNKLNNFSCLAHLEFENKHDGHTTFLQIVALCPHLISLNYTSNVALSSYAIAETHLKRIISSTSTRTATPSFNYQLKSLNLRVHSFTTAYIRYLTYFAPKSLDAVHLISTNRNVDFYNCIETNGMEEMLKLAHTSSS